MVEWSSFIYFSSITVILWIVAIVLIYLNKSKALSTLFVIAGILVFMIFIIGLWRWLGHPPFRTMGETRLWYSLFIMITGLVIYLKWKYKWLIAYSAIVSTVFMIINIVKPELHFTNLMPALRSPWFIPHVSSYILSYSILGAAFICGLMIVFSKKSDKNELYILSDNLVAIGFGLLLAGMLMGALWAKEAWGDFWTWDPKETWAFTTAVFYLVFIHLRRITKTQNMAAYFLIISFILLLITWLGVSYLPIAEGSMHAY